MNVKASETANDSPAPVMDSLNKTRESNWPAVLFFIHIHLLSVYGLWLLIFEAKFMTLLFFVTLCFSAMLGVATGAHRLWAHRTYTATASLRVALMLFHTLAGQGSIYDWVQYHRFHHKHSNTDNDPYNYNKGFLYAHILSRLRKLSPYQEKLKEAVDMSDVENDSIVKFQKNFYWLLYGITFVLLPLNVPLEFWDETILNTVFIIGVLRYGVVLHAAWLVESAVCLWGLKPGKKYPADSNTVFILTKTFWPHYHYLVPCDYKTGEYGTYDSGCFTAFIRVWAALGLATELRTVETTTVQQALAQAANSRQPLQACLDNALKLQQLPEHHYLKR